MAFLLQRNDLALTSLAFPDSKKPVAGSRESHCPLSLSLQFRKGLDWSFDVKTVWYNPGPSLSIC